ASRSAVLTRRFSFGSGQGHSGVEAPSERKNLCLCVSVVCLSSLHAFSALTSLLLPSSLRYNHHQSIFAVSWAFGTKDARTMIRALIAWSVGNPLIVLLGVAVLVGVGAYSFLNVNVEAYPDPAPPIIEVVAQYPGASAQEVERQVTIPLEVTLAGMPGLQVTRSKSLFGLSHLRNQFHYGISYKDANQEVINRL